MHGGVGDNLAQWEVGSGLVTFVPGDVETARLVVHMSNKQALVARIAV